MQKQTTTFSQQKSSSTLKLSQKSTHWMFYFPTPYFLNLFFWPRMIPFLILMPAFEKKIQKKCFWIGEKKVHKPILIWVGVEMTSPQPQNLLTHSATPQAHLLQNVFDFPAASARRATPVPPTPLPRSPTHRDPSATGWALSRSVGPWGRCGWRPGHWGAGCQSPGFPAKPAVGLERSADREALHPPV